MSAIWYRVKAFLQLTSTFIATLNEENPAIRSIVSNDNTLKIIAKNLYRKSVQFLFVSVLKQVTFYKKSYM